MLQILAYRFVNFVDWFIPDEIQAKLNYVELQKARMICISGFFGFFVPWILLTIVPYYPQKFKYIFYGLWALAVFALFGFKIFKVNLKISEMVCTLGVTTVLCTFILNHGITFSGTTNWLSTAVLMGIFLVSIGWGVFLSLVMIAALIGYYILFAENGLTLPEFWTLNDWQSNLHGDQIMALIFNTVMVILFLVTKEKSDEELISSQEFIREQQETIFKESRMAELGKISGGIAHEINNPMTIILANAQRIKKEMLVPEKERDTEKILKMLERIEKTGNRVGKIVDGLKHYSRDASRDSFEPVTLTNMFEEVKEMFHEKMHHMQVEFKVESECELPLVKGRFAQIYQILVNLLDNACDAIENEENKWITLKCYEDEESIFLAIIDSGSGIPKEIEDQVFQPFFTTKAVGKGTGLGLSICSNIMHEHQGELLIDRSHGDSRIVLKFPKDMF